MDARKTIQILTSIVGEETIRDGDRHQLLINKKDIESIFVVWESIIANTF